MTMYIGHVNDVEEKDVQVAKETTIRWLITPKLGAKNFVMRYFVIKRRGEIPLHQHDWEHEIFIVKGEGYLTKDGKNWFKVVPGSFIYIPPNEPHGYKNEDSETFEFICLIPAKKEAVPEDEWAE